MAKIALDRSIGDCVFIGETYYAFNFTFDARHSDPYRHFDRSVRPLRHAASGSASGERYGSGWRGLAFELLFSLRKKRHRHQL